MRRAVQAIERSESLQETAICLLFVAALLDMAYLAYFLIV